MHTFATSGTVSGSPDDALQFALTTFTNNGFAIIERTATSATLTGPGLNSTRQNPILGASKVNIRVEGQSLHVNAELGGVDSMRRFMLWFPMLLGLGMGLFFGVCGIVFGQQHGVGFGVPWAQGWRWMLVAIGFAMLPVAPWLVLSPIIARVIRNRTHRALQTLVSNAGYAAKPS